MLLRRRRQDAPIAAHIFRESRLGRSERLTFGPLDGRGSRARGIRASLRGGGLIPLRIQVFIGIGGCQVKLGASTLRGGLAIGRDPGTAVGFLKGARDGFDLLLSGLNARGSARRPAK